MIIKAFAKINLTLDIVGKRDDGYHLIDSVFQSVGLFDNIEIQKDKEVSVFCEGVEQSKNTVFTAANEFFQFTGISGGIKIKIDKGIPMLSGLGGGSADAAAVIIALDKIYDTNLSEEDLKTIALKCGADVPFCLKGGTARVGGIGEKVTAIPNIKGFWAVIVKSGDKPSTADMYRKLDYMPEIPPVTDKFISFLNAGQYNEAFLCMDNAFCSVAEKGDILKALKSERPLGACLSGSGPSCFAIFSNEDQALIAAEKLKKQGYSPMCASFESSANIIIE